MGFVCPALPKAAQSESTSRGQVLERGGWIYVLLLSGCFPALHGLSVSLPLSVQAGRG